MQTFRTHHPYEVSEATRAQLALSDTYAELEAELGALLPDGMHVEDELPAAAAPVLERMRALYRGTVVDLDRAFGELLGDLDARGLGDACVVFTSDHGEAFGEHGLAYHGNSVWNEQVRVPLLMRGAGLAPRGVEAPVSQVDLAPTLLALAGVDKPAGWRGFSLLEGDPGERAVLSFACTRGVEASDLALIARGRKLVLDATPDAIEAGEVELAFDAAADVGETRDVAGAEREALRALLEEHAGLARGALERVAPREDARLRPETLSVLDALGYTGDE